MATRKASLIAPGIRPRERRGLLRWLWLIWAIGCSGVALLSALLLLQAIPTQSPSRFSGVLHLQPRIQDLILPAGAVLKSVLVQKGDTVMAGQTLALIDMDALAQALRSVEADLDHARQTRNCLGEITAPSHFNSRVSPHPPAAQPLARNTCQLQRKKQALALNRLHQELRDLQVDTALDDKRLRLLLHQNASRLDALARANLALMLARRQAQSQRQKHKLEQKLVALHLQHQDQLQQDMARLKKEISDLSAQRQKLALLQDHPRLSAPNTGKVRQIWLDPGGGATLHDRPLLNLETDQADHYLLRFDLPRRMLGLITRGDLLQLEPAELAPGHPATTSPKVTAQAPLKPVHPPPGLSARVIRIDLKSGGPGHLGRAEVTLRLTQDSQSWLTHLPLAKVPGHLALQIKRPEQSLLSHLRRALGDLPRPAPWLTAQSLAAWGLPLSPPAAQDQI